MRMGQRIIPVDSCGCYVPAGRYPCLTSAVMSVMPAKVAGVKRVVACSPPGRDRGITPGILYTMHKMGVDEIYCVGGAQAIGALAFGTESIRPVDLVVGPGNQFVMEAKRQVFGTVGIDFLAGPSECMVIADHTARPDYIAADLLAQCEARPQRERRPGDDLRGPCHETLREIERQLKERTTEEVARTAWENKGIVAVVESLADAARYANEYAPEHLEIHTADRGSSCQSSGITGPFSSGKTPRKCTQTRSRGPTTSCPPRRGAVYRGALGRDVHEGRNPYGGGCGGQPETGALFGDAIHLRGMDAHRYAAAVRLKTLTP